jgi:hypothetical protein
MSFVGFSASLDKSHHGPQHPFKHAEIAVDNLADILNLIENCLFVVKRSGERGGHTIGHDTCYCEHLGEHG